MRTVLMRTPGTGPAQPLEGAQLLVRVRLGAADNNYTGGSEEGQERCLASVTGICNAKMRIRRCPTHRSRLLACRRRCILQRRRAQERRRFWASKVSGVVKIAHKAAKPAAEPSIHRETHLAMGGRSRNFMRTDKSSYSHDYTCCWVVEQGKTSCGVASVEYAMYRSINSHTQVGRD